MIIFANNWIFAAHKLKIKQKHQFAGSHKEAGILCTPKPSIYLESYTKRARLEIHLWPILGYSLEIPDRAESWPMNASAQFDAPTLAGNRRRRLVFWFQFWLESAGNPAESSFHQTYPKSRAWRTRNSRIHRTEYWILNTEPNPIPIQMQSEHHERPRRRHYTTIPLYSRYIVDRIKGTAAAYCIQNSASRRGVAEEKREPGALRTPAK